MRDRMSYWKKICVFVALGVMSCGALLVSAPHADASYSTDREYLEALDWMYQMGMTKYNKSAEYNPEGELLREQAAKFFVEYAKSQWVERDTNKVCTFTDSADADETLMIYLTEACELGIMKGSQGKFLPKQVMNKAQALTVLVRIGSWLEDESVTPRWANYFGTARKSWLTKETNVWAVENPVSRYEMALLLARAAWRTVATITDPDLEETLALMNMLTPYLRTN